MICIIRIFKPAVGWFEMSSGNLKILATYLNTLLCYWTPYCVIRTNLADVQLNVYFYMFIMTQLFYFERVNWLKQQRDPQLLVVSCCGGRGRVIALLSSFYRNFIRVTNVQWIGNLCSNFNGCKNTESKFGVLRMKEFLFLLLLCFISSHYNDYLGYLPTIFFDFLFPFLTNHLQDLFSNGLRI